MHKLKLAHRLMTKAYRLIYSHQNELAANEFAAERSLTSARISHLIKSGHPQDQAVAIALDEERKGKI